MENPASAKVGGAESRTMRAMSGRESPVVTGATVTWASSPRWATWWRHTAASQTKPGIRSRCRSAAITSPLMRGRNRRGPRALSKIYIIDPLYNILVYLYREVPIFHEFARACQLPQRGGDRQPARRRQRRPHRPTGADAPDRAAGGGI